MSAPAIKGWCPGAWRPLRSGDGYLVRLRPRLARLEAAEVEGLCAAARATGSGVIELTNRANLQIRGVREAALAELHARLERLGLLDPDADTERRRNILIAPDWVEGDDSWRLARCLSEHLADLPPLPDKLGVAIDAGSAPILHNDPADFRIERGESGGLILRADGRAMGRSLRDGEAIPALIALAGWFVESGGSAAGRMARHPASLPADLVGDESPMPPRPPIRPGSHPCGQVLGLAFGHTDADTLQAFMAASEARALRITPWRMLIAEGAKASSPFDLVMEADSPLLRVDACPGAPYCPQASVPTRSLARRLAPLVEGRLHVSGCAKGCARARPADLVLTGRDGEFDLARHARAGDPPEARGLSPEQILARFEEH